MQLFAFASHSLNISISGGSEDSFSLKSIRRSEPSGEGSFVNLSSKSKKSSSGLAELPDLGEFLQCKSDYDSVQDGVRTLSYTIDVKSDLNETDRIIGGVRSLLTNSDYCFKQIDSGTVGHYYYSFTGDSLYNCIVLNGVKADLMFIATLCDDGTLNLTFYFIDDYFMLVSPGKKLGSKAVKGGKSTSSNKNGKLIVDPIDADLYKITKSSVYIQNPVAYFGGNLEVDEITEYKDTYVVYDFRGDTKNYSVFESYISKMINGNYNLKLIDSHSKVYSDAAYYDYCINYTGTGKVNETVNGTFSTNTVCNFMAYSQIDGSKYKACIWIPNSMKIVDLGLRYGGRNVSAKLAGESAAAGLYKNSDGSYSTSDGRLKAKPGKAMVIRDGKTYNVNACLVKDKITNKDELRVELYYGTEGIYFGVAQNSLSSGNIMRLTDLAQSERWIWNMKWDSLDNFAGYKTCPLLGFGHGKDFITPLATNENQFKDVTVRVMYYEKDVVAVYYIYAEFKSAPKKVEALCVVDCNPKNVKVVDDDSSSGGSSSSRRNNSSDKDRDERRETTCPYCSYDHMEECSRCDGDGGKYEYHSVPNYSGHSKPSYEIWVECSKCNGKGKVRCSHCGGDGWIYY